MEYKNTKKNILRVVTAPLIYMQIVPLAIIDFSTEIYHQINFRVYGIPLVKRSEYIKIDRHKLKYLNFIQKINCMYCGYANGLAGYISQIGSRTEQYWCGIKHEPSQHFHEPAHHKNFVAYGDEQEFKKTYKRENQ